MIVIRLPLSYFIVRYLQNGHQNDMFVSTKYTTSGVQIRNVLGKWSENSIKKGFYM